MCHAEYHERRIEGVHQCARVGGRCLRGL
jgi:hypothetical protein